MNEKPNVKLLLAYDLQWFAKEGEGGEKTEPATQKKLKDARNDGKVAKSKELTAAFMLVVLFLVLKIFISFVGENLLGMFPTIYNKIPDFLDENLTDLSSVVIMGLIQQISLRMLVILLPFFGFGFAITLMVTLLQVGWNISTKPLHPKFSNFNPISGVKRMFSKESLIELLKSVVKIVLIALITYISIKDKVNDLFLLYEIPLNSAIAYVGTIIIDTGYRISLFYILVGVADFIYQKHKFKEDMKMTKQEVKDEWKNTEGDPQVKNKIRQKMMEASRRRMMQDVPQADVVITNPTHYAVALKYVAEEHRAPIVVAKGEDYLAQRIKEIARESNIEIVENKPLARMLYANVDIGAEIPPELYQAVADILAMVYGMKHSA